MILLLKWVLLAVALGMAAYGCFLIHAAHTALTALRAIEREMLSEALRKLARKGRL